MRARRRRIDYLELDDLLEIATGILGNLEVRDVGALAAAAARPRATVLGQDAYPELAGKAGALLHSLARNHALVDGNKRLAWAATRVLCLLNGQDLDFTVDEAEALVVSAATGTHDAAELGEAIAGRLRPADGPPAAGAASI